MAMPLKPLNQQTCHPNASEKKPCLNVHHLSGLNAGRNVNLEDIITSTWSTGRFEPSL